MTCDMGPITLAAKDFLRPDETVVQGADRIAAEIARHHSVGTPVVLSVRGVRGLSSSFFNVVLAAVASGGPGHLGPDWFKVETDTQVQRDIFERSLRAIRGELG